MSQTDVFVASDYAGVSVGDLTLYYGYEYVRDDEWCFVAKRGKVIIAQLKSSEISKTHDSYECEEMLLLGIAKMIASGMLVVAEKTV